MLWVEARDAAKHPTVHRTAPDNKNYLSPNVSKAKLRNLELEYLILPSATAFRKAPRGSTEGLLA